MGETCVVNRSEQSQPSFFSPDSPHVNRLQGTRPSSDEFDIPGRDIEMLGEHPDHRPVGVSILGRA